MHTDQHPSGLPSNRKESEEIATTDPAAETHPPDELGAHVSAAGGVDRAPGRATAIGAFVFQLFTRQPNRWASAAIRATAAERFRHATADVGFVTAHDSYLINLASPDPVLRERSAQAFIDELERAHLLELDALVTHPGNATDGDAESGMARNADEIAAILEACPGPTRILLELTAGSGSSVGGSFEALHAIIERIPLPERNRIGVCFDSCHAWVAGFDLQNDYEGIWKRAEDTFGLHRIELFHLNDAKAPFGSHRDRHEHIGQGTIGPEPFRRIMNDDRFRATPKILETPKGEDGVTADRINLARLRAFREPQSS